MIVSDGIASAILSEYLKRWRPMYRAASRLPGIFAQNGFYRAPVTLRVQSLRGGGQRVPDKGDIEEIRDALLTVRLRLESHLAHDACWRALKMAELPSVVAEQLGSDVDADNMKLHRKLLRNSRVYRAYTRVMEAVRILSATPSAQPAAPTKDDGQHLHRHTHAEAVQNGSDAAADRKPRIKVKAVSLAVRQS